LDPQIEMSLYRMVQESLSNITRHSQAAQAWVEVSFISDEFKIEIRDNGKGFVVPVNSSDFSKKGHFGLVGLQERAEIIGADLHLTSIPGLGTTVQVHLKDRQNSLLETS
jgi:two-component system NarL family sensor kinase